jgi:hypothetical protein
MINDKKISIIDYRNLSELRQLHLGRAYLSPEEALNWANGKNWARLASYCEDAYQKRESRVITM